MYTHKQFKLSKISFFIYMCMPRLYMYFFWAGPDTFTAVFFLRNKNTHTSIQNNQLLYQQEYEGWDSPVSADKEISKIDWQSSHVYWCHKAQIAY